MASSDWELVQRARTGDRDAFRELVERYQRKIAALALGMLRNRDDALDIVQETFTKAYQNLDRFKGESAFYTWVYRIAYNLCVDQQRRAAKEPQLTLDADEDARPARCLRTTLIPTRPSPAPATPRSPAGCARPSEI